MLVFPAVDIARGRCVRLAQGKPERETAYFEKPVEAALHWQQAGAEALHVVDLDRALGGVAEGEKAPAPGNVEAVAEILDAVRVPVQVAGGLRSRRAVRAVLEAGAARAVVGTAAARDPEWAVRLCRELPGRVVIAVDAREGRVAVEGWRELAETSPVVLAQRLAPGGPAAFLYTDVNRDGMLTRPNFEAVERLLEAVETPVIASGGVSSLGDVEQLGECGADAVVIGKALYERRFGLAEAVRTAAGYPSRLPPSPQPPAAP